MVLDVYLILWKKLKQYTLCRVPRQTRDIETYEEYKNFVKKNKSKEWLLQLHNYVWLFPIYVFPILTTMFTLQKSLFETFVSFYTAAFIESFFFIFIHFTLHISFAKQFPYIFKLAYLHHYVDSTILGKFHLQHRTNYFTLVVVVRHIIVYLLNFEVGYYFHMIYIMNSLTHEYYHTVPHNKRYDTMGMLYPVWELLENVGIISSAKHKRHHNHDKKNIDQREYWLDLHWPIIFHILNPLAEFPWFLHKRNKNQVPKRMAVYTFVIPDIMMYVGLGLLVALGRFNFDQFYLMNKSYTVFLYALVAYLLLCKVLEYTYWYSTYLEDKIISKRNIVLTVLFSLLSIHLFHKIASLVYH